MSSYYNYRFRTYGLITTLKKELGKVATAKQIWRMCLDNYRNDGDEIDLFCMVEECVALAETPDFLFIDNLQLANVIQKSNFKADQITMNDGIQFISFPKGFKIEGNPANGVMFGWGNEKEREVWLQTLQYNCGAPITGYIIDEKFTGYVSFTYNSPFEANVTCRLQIPFEHLARFIFAENAEEMSAILEGHILSQELDDKNKRYQLKLCQMVLKTLVYAQAMPDKVIRGCPDKRAGNNKFKHNSQILHAPENMHGSNAPTAVGYHWRQLSHEKYYKGEHKKKAIGSRWSFVKPHERGMKAHTINE